jgi:hypothetical protein
MTFRRYREVPRCAKCANWNYIVTFCDVPKVPDVPDVPIGTVPRRSEGTARFRDVPNVPFGTYAFAAHTI